MHQVGNLTTHKMSATACAILYLNPDLQYNDPDTDPHAYPQNCYKRV